MIELESFLEEKGIDYEKVEISSTRIFQPTCKYICRCDSYNIKVEIITFPAGTVEVIVCDCVCLHSGLFSNLLKEIISKFFEKDTLGICERSMEISPELQDSALLFVLLLIFKGKTRVCPTASSRLKFGDIDPVLERRLRFIAEGPWYIEYDYDRITHLRD